MCNTPYVSWVQNIIPERASQSQLNNAQLVKQ